MARKPKQVQTDNGQLDLFNDWLVGEPISDTPIVKDKKNDIPTSVDEARHILALRLAQHLTDGRINPCLWWIASFRCLFIQGLV